MSFKQFTALACALVALGFGSQTMAQDDLTCDDIEFSRVVTDNYPSIADACDAVVQRDGTLYARIQVEVQRIRGNNLTFRVLNNDGTSGGSYTQNVGPNWRANIGGRTYRARDLVRGQQLNVYLPSDRWAFVHETADEEPDTVAEVIPVAAAPMLPKTASQLPLAGLVGAGFLLLGATLTLYRRRASQQVASNR
jgi:LPXTG-motif cell wall-anchored protein